MEKGKLIIQKAKSGKYFARVLLQNGNPIDVPGYRPPNDENNNREIEYERFKGIIIKIVCDGKVIYDVAEKSKETHKEKNTIIEKEIVIDNGRIIKTTSRETGYTETTQTITTVKGNIDLETGTAKAPYNFIPLNDKVIYSKKEIPNFDKFHTDKNTGYIELSIENLTPLYIRGTSNEQSKFYSPTGEFAIPGSSIRGMIRTLVEIVSYSRFEIFNDKRLYFRAFADKSNLRDEYSKIMSSDERNKYNMKAGILVKDGFDYYIKPAEFKREEKKDSIKGKMLYENKDRKGYATNFCEKRDKGYVVGIKNVNEKMNYYHIYNIIEDSKYHIQLAKNSDGDYLDIIDYQNDENRSLTVPNLLKLLNEHKEVPCFFHPYQETYMYEYEKDKFREETRQRIGFGHNPYFRLPYKYKIGDLLHDAHKENFKNTNDEDYVNRIFGNLKRSSRVHFSDAKIINKTNPELGEGTIKVLATPKPTTFQHYVEQVSLESNIKSRKTYNYNNTKIRGYKLYWHNHINEQEWKESKPDIKEKIHTKINPLKTGTQFQGRVYFENLDDIELGILLSVLSLPAECAHKIGMGKPYGLGSIKITPTLHLSNRKKRYSSLAAEWTIPDPDIKEYINAFVKELSTQVKMQLDSIWDHPRFKELKTMLTFDNQIPKEQLSYMEIEKKTGRMNPKTQREEKINEFSNRPILSQPTKYGKRK